MLLVKKLHLKPGAQALVLNAPAGYTVGLSPLPEGAALSTVAENNRKYDFVQLFVKDSSELAGELSAVAALLRPETVFWIAYPKKSSGIASDLEMTGSWEALEKLNYTSVAAAAINERWTALRWKPSDKVKSNEASNENIAGNHYGEYIDLQNRVIAPPPELKSLLEKNPAALHFFESLSFTNKKEYVVWILGAKQDKTRSERLSKTIEKLKDGRKNPSEKELKQ